MNIERAIRKRARAIVTMRWSLRFVAFALLTNAASFALDAVTFWDQAAPQAWNWDAFYLAQAPVLIVMCPAVLLVAMSLDRLRFEAPGWLWRVSPLVVGTLSFVMLPTSTVSLGYLLRESGVPIGHDVMHFSGWFFGPMHTPNTALSMASLVLLAVIAARLMIRKGIGLLVVFFIAFCLIAMPLVDASWYISLERVGFGVWLYGQWWSVTWALSAALMMTAVIAFDVMAPRLFVSADGSVCPGCGYPAEAHRQPVCPECGIGIDGEIRRILTGKAQPNPAG